MSRSAIELQGIVKSWGEQAVLKQMDLTIQEGKFTALLGPSGCGKSTLLRIIAGLEAPDQGRLLINGHDATHMEPAKRGLSMVFQSYALFPHLNVADNILFGLQVRRADRRQQQERLREALALTNLEGLQERRPGQLSGGQRQRVALARSIVSGHRICLMDEPLSNLDAKLRHTVRHEIRSLQQRLGLTVVYVTHDQTEAMGMADHVVLLNAGRIEQQGRAQDLYGQPMSVFTASFIGSPPMMMIHSDQVPLGLWPSRRQYDQPHRVLVGVRPENLNLHEAGEQFVAATVVHQEFQGADAYVYVRLDDGHTLIVRAPHSHRFEAGTRCGLSWHPADAFYFNQDSGARLPTPSADALTAASFAVVP
ncbi:ABC transporter ATP-binding protein [Alcaligenes ammonioxydans]|uniref:ABC transporter ATP-binding protein n=1 Tax=Alcaligenes TaxID=507 RepID=UPI000269EADB|nr:ABC transporter ATP-binding protein [Alcaligenes ammonioxydans]EJC61929.1 ABC transporter-like protein [Alcaligenes faecalis subsp. faecalis NCIB 8687]MCH1879110.1 ABC transporter ATP-binding protein [Alcaligenes ammonioxydans]WGQ36000.1 ABC transporter ATP-binding protein [Alcaligenes faecalis]HRK84087.1 ABC transporter ATP-binding protein [Alcaligenes faecalis]